MQVSVAPETQTPSRKRFWAGWMLSLLAVVFMLFSGIIKLIKIQPVTESFATLGYPDLLARPIGALEVGCTLLYLFPWTSPVGAILLTGFLGGAVTTHLRVGDPWMTHTIFPIYIGALAWVGLILRSPRLWRALTSRA